MNNAGWQWGAQIHLTHGVSFTSGKKYVFSCDITTSNATNNITIKVCDEQERLYKTDFATAANVANTYSSEFTSQGNETSAIVFDFGYASANTGITISNISIIEKEPEPKVSECSGSRGHEGGSPHFDFEISYDGTTTTIIATPKGSGINFDFCQINVNGSVTDLMGGESEKASVQYTTTAAANTELYIAFLYSPTDFGGNYQTTSAFQANSSDPNIIYYKVGDCAASGAANPHLTLTNPTKSSVLLPKGESVTVAYTSENDAAATIASPDAYVSISGNVVTAASTGTATVNVSQAEVANTWNEASVSFEVNAFDWDDVSFIATSDYKFKTLLSGYTLDGAIISWKGHNSIHLIMPDAVGINCSLTGNFDIEGAGLFIYTDAFTVRQTPFTISWKGNDYECYVYYNLDETPPTISDVTVTSYTHDQAVITITANEAFISAEVFNNNVSMGTFTPTAGAITVTGLTASTTYNQLTVKVKDAANNVSAAAAISEFTTSAAPSITPATYNGYCTNGNFFVKYAITRNVYRQLEISANIEWLPTYGGVVAQIWRSGDHINLSQSGSTFTGTFLSDLTDDDVLSLYFRFEYSNGATGLDAFSYTVGSEQTAPASIPAGAVVLDKAATTLSVGETDNLTATVYPSFATSASSITWASSETAYATVDNGIVTAVAAGPANITASCGGVTSAPCAVTVATSLSEAKFYGTGVFSDNLTEKNAYAYEYTFTRATNHNVTLDVVFSEDVTGLIEADNFQIFINNALQHMTYTAATKTATYDFGSQSDNAVISYRFYFVMNGGGVHQTANTTYAVGSSNEKVYACVADEDIDNSAVLAAYDGRTAQVIVDRSFTSGNLYTLVMPFDADATQTAAQLPGSLTKLNNTIVKDNGDLRINFVDATAIEAGVPYLYVPSENVVNPSFTGITISKDLDPTEPADGRAKYYGIYAPTTGSVLKAFSNAYVLGSDQYLYAVTGLRDDQPMKALRGYFVLNFPASLAPNRTARVIFNYNDAETATGIESIQTSECSVQKFIENGQLFIIREGKTYNAQGQLIK
ncbi:MAG: Ig domain-containing protein [Paludibacteraceae bacterium]|nr:Ig domain-containing protein [Paludibacteraceae bacterium]